MVLDSRHPHLGGNEDYVGPPDTQEANLKDLETLLQTTEVVDAFLGHSLTQATEAVEGIEVDRVGIINKGVGDSVRKTV